MVLVRSLLSDDSLLSLAGYVSLDSDTDVDDAAQPKSKSSKRVANPLSDDELGDRVVYDLQLLKLGC